MSTPKFTHYDAREPHIGREVFDRQDILHNFGIGDRDLEVEYPEFYEFLMTAKVEDCKSGMYGQGTYDCWQRIS